MSKSWFKNLAAFKKYVVLLELLSEKSYIKNMKKRDNTQKALNLWAIILIVWSLYRANLRLPEWFDEFIIKPLVFILPVYFYIARIEKGKFFKGISWSLKSIKKDLLVGVGIGLILFLTVVVANSIKAHKLILIKINPSLIGYFLIISLMTAVSEEILSRGFVLKRLYQESNNVLTSSFYASFLFLFLHIPSLFTSEKLNGYTIIFILLTDMVLSLVNSLLFLDRKNLTPSILVHAFYNLTIYLFI